MTSTPEIEVHPDAPTLASIVAGALLDRIADAQASGHVPHVVLTGGTIAEIIHREIARMADDSGVDWGAVEFWFGDDRFVPVDSEDRNALQARRAFLDELLVPAARIHETLSASAAHDVEEAAHAYAHEVVDHGPAEFDIVMLSIGPDGHIASLFPGSSQLQEDHHAAVAVTDSPKPPPERISLTLGTLNRAKEVWFLGSGESKADVVAEALSEGPVEQLPARGVRGRQGTTFFLDRAAASQL